MAYTLTLDPPAVATGRTALELNSGSIGVEQAGVDWGDAAIQAFVADQRWGSAPVDYRVPNRTVTIPLGLGMDGTSFAAAKSKLTEKVALIQREGGWLRRGDTNWYADIVNASLTLPDKWHEAGGIEVDIKLVLECLPDFYGDEITLDAVSGTGQLHTVLKASGTQAVVAGDHTARCRIVVTDTSGNAQDGLLWGLRSRHYDAASTAALFYEAEALTPLDAAATHVLAGASGGSTMRHNSLPGGSWCPVLLTDLLAGTAAWTHQGSYQLWARVYSATATPQLRFVWGVGDVAHPVINRAVQVPGAAGFYIVNLGAVRLDAPPTGNYRWHGVIQALAVTQGDPVEIDCLYLQPLDESAGECQAVQSTSTFGIEVVESAGAGADDGAVGTLAWTNPGNITAEDGVCASVGGSSGITHYLKATGFGFAIPAGATISGIRLDIKRASFGGGRAVGIDNRVSLVKAGTVQVTNYADGTPWPRGTLTFASYGGPTDLWGTTWTPTDINNANFGAALEAINESSLPADSIQVDFIRITVFYTTAGGFTTAADAVLYANHTAELRTEGMFRQDSTGTVEGAIAQVTGDLPRLPPSGAEGRAVELFAKVSRGDLKQQGDPSPAPLPDAGLDTFSVQVLYRPTFLTGP